MDKLTFTQKVKKELSRKIEENTLKRKRDIIQKAFENGNPIPYGLDEEQRVLRVLLKGAFLGSGSINDPAKGFHMEFSCKSIEHARYLILLLKSFEIEGKLGDSKNAYRVYIKKSEEVGNILKIIGAYNALFEIENTKVLHEFRSDIQRKVNFETANIKKIASASARQLYDIKIIEEKIGLSSLKESLMQAALIRKESPEASLEELGRALNPKVGKSGMNHRFREIHKKAMELKDE